MEKIGILVVSYGSRDSAIIDALARSEEYVPELYIADKQNNPFNLEKASCGGAHAVIPELSIEKICDFAEKHRNRIRFGIVGSEGPIIQGIRDLIEKRIKIPIICPTKRYAIEGSKVRQRNMLQLCSPKSNPLFKVFDPVDLGPDPKTQFKDWLLELGGPENAVIKPDRPGFGKGVGVGGEHFNSVEEAYNHFWSIYGGNSERVVIEQKIEGEESSYQAFCDGKHLITLPETRDYKRAFQDDYGPNTGGMGSYKGENERLPFMKPSDREEEIKIVNNIFRHLAEDGNNPELRGIPFYVAFMHSANGPKILEINSRPGDPEIINILPIINQDFVELCLNMIDQELYSVKFKPVSSVVTYKVPPAYGGFAQQFPSKVGRKEVGTPLNLQDGYEFAHRNSDNLRLYPGSMELRSDGKIYSLSSRTICSVGIAGTTDDARKFSLLGIEKIHGGGLWYRSDVASRKHINRSIEHMNRLRSK
jgi:phosphoribosylamine--glycine ligase